MSKKLFLFFVFLFCISCHNNSETPNPQKNTKRDKSSKNIDAGEIHNNFMSYINNNFSATQQLSSKSEAVLHIKNFLKTNTAGYENLSQEQKDVFNSTLDNYSEYFDYKKVLSVLNNETKIQGITSNQMTFSELIIDLGKYNIISLDEKDELLSLQNFLSSIYKTEVSHAQLTNYISNLSDKISNLEYKILPVVVSIAKKSNQWWTDNPQEGGIMTPQGLIGTDIVGAAFGAAISAGTQYLVTGGVRGDMVLAGAASTAIMSSGGVITKVTKWLGW